MTHLEFKQLDEMSAREAFELFKLRAGCARVFPTAKGPRFGRFVVAPLARGTGLGPGISRAGQKFTRRWPGDLVVEAQAGLVGYYNRFGFIEEGEQSPDAGVPHVVMRERREAVVKQTPLARLDQHPS